MGELTALPQCRPLAGSAGEGKEWEGGREREEQRRGVSTPHFFFTV